MVDIETRAGRPECIERDFRIAWSPSATWKPETIGKRFVEARAKADERAALLDSAEIAAIAVKLPDVPPLVAHGLVEAEALSIDGVAVQGFAGESELLAAFAGWLSANTSPSTIITGHNVVSFDLPKLRLRMVRAGVALPAALASPEQGVCDTMRLFCSRFSLSKAPMISLADCCEVLGLSHHKSVVDGAGVGDLIEQGQVETLCRYAGLDVLAEEDLYLRLTGQRAERSSDCDAGLLVGSAAG